MTGTLGLFSLVDLFQLLSSSSRTGRLLIDHPEGKAKVYFDKGKVVHADFEQLKGDTAIYELFKNEQGSFEFGVGLPSPEISISQSTENLLLEAIRRVDEYRNRQSQIEETQKSAINAQAIPIFAEKAPDAGSLTLYAQEVAILRLIDGRNTVEMLAERAGMSLQETKQVVGRLAKVGALGIRGRKPRVARLVTQLAQMPLAPNTVGIDSNITTAWEKVLGAMPEEVACRLPDGRVQVFRLISLTGVGPYILCSRDLLFTSSIAVNVPLLVKPNEV